MATTMHVDIVSAEAEIYSGTAVMLIASAELGDVGIAPRHAQMICRLKPGQVRVQLPSGEEHLIYVSGGLLEVQPHLVTVLSDTAIRASDLDEVAAEEAKRRAEEALSDRQGEFEYAQARAQLAQAVAQLQTIQKLRKTLKS